MATRIVCVETEYPHRHINAVGVGDDPSSADFRRTVEQVRAALYNGERFYTQSPSTGQTADVEPYDAWTPSGVVYTIKSAPDCVPDNNLDNLRVCSWK